MNDQERWDLEWLKQRHAELQQEMSELAGRLKLLETKQDKAQPTTPPPPLPPRIVVKLPDTSQPEIAQSAAPAEAPRPIPPIPPPTPSPIPPATPPVSQPVVPPIEPAPAPIAPQSPARPKSVRLKLQEKPDETKFLKCLCVLCGGHIEFPASALGDTIPCPHCNGLTCLSPTVEPPPVPPRLVARPVPASPPPKSSFEMRLGTVLARPHRDSNAVDRTRLFRGVHLPKFYRPARPDGKGFAALRRQRGLARARRLVAAQGGEGILEELCAGALRRRVGSGVFHDLRGASHPAVVHHRQRVAGWRIVTGLGGLHGLDCGS